MTMTTLSSPVRSRAAATPRTLRMLLLTCLALSLAWGVLGGWAASEHSDAASAVVTVDEPLSLDARQLYQSLADADVTVTTAFLASSQPPLAQLQRYQDDVASAAADLARLRAAGGTQVTAALASITAGLPVYTGYVADAESEYSLGFPLTGGSFLQVASEQAHLVLLPAAKTVFTQENAALSAASGTATGLPLMIVALVFAVLAVIVLFRAQRWLTRRTNRTLNAGLLAATVLLVISAIVLAAGFVTARSDLDRGIGQGSAPAESLAQAGIGVDQIRSDAVLNVISRSGDTSFQQDSSTTSATVGSLLADADTGPGASSAAAASREATSWDTANAQVYKLGAAADYAAERTMVTGSGTSAGYDALESGITAAIGDDQSVFQSSASSGSSALSDLEAVVIAAAVLMALSCAWGLNRRLAEYR
jgi:hypothetical protein